MSDRHPGHSPQPSSAAADHAEEFGVELDWPEDELAAAPPRLGGEPLAHGEGSDGPGDRAADADAGPDAQAQAWDAGNDGGGEGRDVPADDVLHEEADPDDAAGTAAGEVEAGRGRADEPFAAVDDPDGADETPTVAWPASLVSSRSSALVPDRSEALQGALSTLAMRIDALVGATSTSRSSITQRLNDHIDTVGRLARSQLADLAEFQHANERTLGDVRRSVHGSEELLRRLSAQLEQVQGDVAALQRELGDRQEGQARLAEVAAAVTRLESSVELVPVDEPGLTTTAEQIEALRGDLLAAASGRNEAQEELARHVASLRAALEALSDEPDEPLLDPPVATEATLTRLEESVAELGAQRQDPELAATLARIEALLVEERVGQSAPVGEALLAELQELRAGIDELRAAAEEPDDVTQAKAIADLRKEVRALRLMIEEALEEPPAPSDAPEAADVSKTLAAVHRELATMRRRISVRAKPVEIQLDDQQADALADAVVARLRLLLEVVPPTRQDGD